MAADSQMMVPSWTMVGTRPLGFTFFLNSSVRVSPSLRETWILSASLSPPCSSSMRTPSVQLAVELGA